MRYFDLLVSEKSFGVSWNGSLLESFEVFWSLLKSFGVFWSLLKSLGLFGVSWSLSKSLKVECSRDSKSLLKSPRIYFNFFEILVFLSICRVAEVYSCSLGFANGLLSRD